MKNHPYLKIRHTQTKKNQAQKKKCESSAFSVFTDPRIFPHMSEKYCPDDLQYPWIVCVKIRGSMDHSGTQYSLSLLLVSYAPWN